MLPINGPWLLATSVARKSKNRQSFLDIQSIAMRFVLNSNGSEISLLSHFLCCQPGILKSSDFQKAHAIEEVVVVYRSTRTRLLFSYLFTPPHRVRTSVSAAPPSIAGICAMSGHYRPSKISLTFKHRANASRKLLCMLSA